jgi:Spy/CpxP family protein refolding chaperone
MTRSRFAAVLAATAITLGTFTLPPTQAAATTGAGAAATQPGQRLKAALSQLNLTGNQIAKIKQILANAKPQFQAAKSNGQTGSKKAVMRQVIKQIMNVLTRPQKTKFMQIMKSYKTQGTGRA